MLAAGRHYDALLPQLGPDTGWARCGILQLATRETDLSAWEWVAERATGATEISADEARAMVPVLGTVVRALHHPRAARVDGRMMCAALRTRPPSSTASRCASGSVDEVRAGTPATVVVDGESISAPAVVIAGGAWTRRLGEQLGVQLPVGPLRGQIAHLGVADHDTGELADRAAGVRPLHGAVGRSPRRGRRDRGRRRLRARRDRGRDERDHARGVARDARPRERDAGRGARRAAPDEHRRLARSSARCPGIANVFVATGHGANGLLLGPISGRLIADLVLGRDPDVDPTPFSRPLPNLTNQMVAIVHRMGRPTDAI